MIRQHAMTPDAQPHAGICRGRVLTTEEMLGLNNATTSWREAAPMLFVGWLALVVIVAHPLWGLATLLAAPVILCWSARLRPIARRAVTISKDRGAL
jgi:hypothetical protein